MPLKVSSQGWVKVQPPPRPRKPPVDPEVKKDSFCSAVRYFACQGVDPSKERLQMLGERGFSPSQADLLRPHSRLERSSTLDEWRHDVQPSRSSSRQSGPLFEHEIPTRDVDRPNRGSGDGGRRRHSDDNNASPTTGDMRNHKSRDGSSTAHPERKNRVASAPVIISALPSPSLRDEATMSEDIVEVIEYADNASVAHTETQSERHCKRNHRHQRAHNIPKAIAEEDEVTSVIPPTPRSSLTPSKSENSRSWYDDLDENLPSSHSVPPPTRSNTVKTRITEFDHKNAASNPRAATEPSLEAIPETAAASSHPTMPKSTPDAAAHAKSVKSLRSERSHKSSRPRRTDDRSDTSSVSSRSSRSESSYTSSVSSYTEDDERSSYCPSRPASPPPPISRHPRPREPLPPPTNTKPHRVSDRTPTAAPSWTSSHSGSSSSYSSGSRSSSAPSMDGYQFQAAIFQPNKDTRPADWKSGYRGYRAPSLSKGNRWETATSALSFD